MGATFQDLLSSVRRPEYTGDNRCVPCTGVNVVIAVGAGVIFGLVWVPAGTAVLVVSLVLIYLRGYLIPGTPRLTQRYLPTRVLELFGKAREAPGFEDAELQASLDSAGALEEGRLTPDFEVRWMDGIERLKGEDGSTSEGVARLLGVDVDAVTVRSYEDGAVVSVAGGGAGRWPSRPALVADVAAATELEERGVETPHAILPFSRAYGELRARLDRCPECGGEIGSEHATAVACCGASETLVLECQDCEARLFEMDED